MASGLVFATVGTTKFDSFITTLTGNKVLAALRERGYNRLLIQIGNGEILPNLGYSEGVDVTFYRFKDSIREDILEADLVISHAGAGSCLEILEAKKPLVVVINEDLMGNHQTELAKQLASGMHLLYCTPTTLLTTLQTMDLRQLKKVHTSKSSTFVEFLDKYMGFKAYFLRHILYKCHRRTYARGIILGLPRDYRYFLKTESSDMAGFLCKGRSKVREEIGIRLLSRSLQCRTKRRLASNDN